jgi:hypothetical protein
MWASHCPFYEQWDAHVSRGVSRLPYDGARVLLVLVAAGILAYGVPGDRVRSGTPTFRAGVSCSAAGWR